MATGWADIRAQARRTVHSTFAGPVTYNGQPVDFTVRWGTRLAVGGNGDLGGEYSGVLEGIDRLVFDLEQLDGVTLRKGDVIGLTAYSRSFLLDTVLPDNGPVTRTWLVVDAVG